MLSLEDYNEKGRPFAVSVGGKKNRTEILYLHDEPEAHRGGLALKTSGKLKPTPNFSREVVYICGPSGCGKSYYCGMYLDGFCSMYPNSNVYVFSEKDKDPSIDKNIDPEHLIRVIVDDDMIDDPINTKELPENSMIVFDDTDSFPEKLQVAVNRLKKNIMETGRSKNIYCIITSHLINPDSKLLGNSVKNEMTSITIFPRACSRYHVNYVFKNHLGLSPDDIDKLLSTKSRWVTLMKNYPQCVFDEKEAYMLHQE